MRVLVLGGDGFCGWPTSLYLSDRGHDVTILDNLSRRNIDNELEVQSLTPIRPIGERVRVWEQVSGRMSFSTATNRSYSVARSRLMNPISRPETCCQTARRSLIGRIGVSESTSSSTSILRRLRLSMMVMS